MGVLAYSILLGCLIAAVSACQTEGEGCSASIACCTNLKCDLRAGPFGFCQKGSAPSGGKTTVPPRPTTTKKIPAAATTKAPSSSSSGYMVSEDLFRKAVTVNGFPAPTSQQYKNFVKGAPIGKFSSKRELAMFLANVIHETGGMQKLKETVPISAWGTTHPDKNYYGRGYIQLSYEANYRAASEALFHDDRLLTNPDMVADDDTIAWNTAFWYWGDRVHSHNGVAQGKFGATIQAINGDLECHGQNQDKASSRFQYYQKILALFVPGETAIDSAC